MAKKRKPKPKRKRRGKGEGACFYSEAKGAWVGRVIVGTKPDGKPRYKEVSAQTQAEVLAGMRRAEEEAREGAGLEDGPGGGKAILTGGYLRHWLDNVAKPSVRESTWQSYERCVRLHLLPSDMAGVRLAELCPHHVERFLAGLMLEGEEKAALSSGNAKKVSEVLSSALEHAARTGLVRSSPAGPVRKPKPEEKEITPFTPQEVKAILALTGQHRLGPLVQAAFGTGARLGELLALGWQHLDLEKGVLRVERSLVVLEAGGFLLREPKSKRGRRTVSLPRFALEALAAHRERMREEGSLQAATVFCAPGAGRGFVRRSTFWHSPWVPLLRNACVPFRKFHSVRHTHVSELLARGESVVDVARRVGDRPEVMLKTYAHWIPGGGSTIAGRLDEMYGG